MTLKKLNRKIQTEMNIKSSNITRKIKFQGNAIDANIIIKEEPDK